MTYEELQALQARGELKIVESVYCPQCGKSYRPTDFVLVHLDLRYIGCGQGDVWQCPTPGCRGTVEYSQKSIIRPIIVTEG